MAYFLNAKLGAPLLALAVLLLGACDRPTAPDPSVSGTEEGAAPSPVPEAPAADTEASAPPPTSPPSSPPSSEAEAPAQTGQLAEETALAPDTVVAARYSGAGADSTPIGVWAETPEDCGKIDQEDEPSEFLIITPSSLRDPVSNCTVTPGEVGDAVPFTATCIAEGQSEERELVVDLIGADTLHYQRASRDEDLELVRCNL